MTVLTDWTEIRREYVESVSERDRPSLNSLADKYKVGQSTLKVRAKKEGWKAQADEFLKSLDRHTRTIRQEAQTVKVKTGELTWDEQCFELAQTVLDRLQERMASDELTTRELEDLTRSLERLHKLGKAAQPEVVEVETISPDDYAGMDEGDLAQLYLEKTKRV